MVPIGNVNVAVRVNATTTPAKPAELRKRSLDRNRTFTI
jgi:hypothetical protein